MSRFKRVLHSVASGYINLVATALYVLVSFPLAMHFFAREEAGVKKFALWALLSQVMGYFSLIDAGLYTSVSRLLIDHKDDRNGGAYGALIKTSVAVSVVQGAILLAAGFFLAPACTHLLKIDDALAPDFIRLLRWQSVIMGASFAVRVFGQLFYANQRPDIVNYTQAVSLAVNLAVLWLAFKESAGVYSLLWANAATLGFCTAVYWVQSLRLRFFPDRGAYGRIEWPQFKEVFAFGKDLFLIGVGYQFILGSQTLIISRNQATLGLEAVALWSVGTKIFTMVYQLVWRPGDFASPVFSEMMVRGERERLCQRYGSFAMLTASLAGWIAVGYVLCNSLFVAIWFNGKFAWPAGNDVLMAAWLVLVGLVRLHGTFITLTKQVGFARYIYFLEGLVFLVLATVTSRWGGLPAIIACSVICSACFSFTYGLWRVRRYFELDQRTVLLKWQTPALKMLAVMIPVAAVVWWGGHRLPVWPRFLINGFVGLVLGGFCFLRMGVPAPLQVEILNRAPGWAQPVLRRVFRRVEGA